MASLIEEFLGITAQKLGESVVETIYMVSISLIIGTIFAFVVAIILAFCRKGGLFENIILYNIFNIIVNIIRSTPFVVLLVAVMPLTKAIVGTRIGSTAALVPLTLHLIPLLARLMENSLLEIGQGLIEAAESMGASTFQIIRYFIFPEAKGSLILSLTTGIVGLIGASAMAGYIGGGGIGALVLNYGYNRFNFKLMYSLVVVLILVTQLVQTIGNRLAAKARKK